MNVVYNTDGRLAFRMSVLKCKVEVSVRAFPLKSMCRLCSLTESNLGKPQNVKADSTNQMVVFILVPELDGLEGSKSQGCSSRLLILGLRAGGKRENEDEMHWHDSYLSFGENAVIFHTLLSTNWTEEKSFATFQLMLSALAVQLLNNNNNNNED